MASQTGTNTELQRDPDVWLDSGDIVVICESTVFCVHEAVLSRHSRALGDLCSGAKTVSKEEHEVTQLSLDITGCTVLRLCDTAYDMKQLLCALYDGLM